MYKSLYTQPLGQDEPDPRTRNVQNFEETRLAWALVRHIGQKRCTFKCVGNFSVRFADDLVDGFFPRRVDVATFFDVDEELAEAHQGDFEEFFRHLKFVGFVVVVVQGLKELAFAGDFQIGGGVDSFRKRMTSVFLDLDVKEFSEVRKPFDELRSGRSVKLDIWEESLQDI